MNKYQILLEQLFSINQDKKMKFGLERCLDMHSALGNPADAFACVHVAGTNGKGSVSTKIAAALQDSGKRVGLFTSPHISTFRERIRINGKMIEENEAEILLEKIIALNSEATFFEIVTMLGLCYFAEKKVDVAVLETGMGGRLDATNIVTPLVSIITSISLEHTQYLGDTLELIAKEKAGIIKRGVPVVIGPRVPRDVVAEKIESLGGKVSQLLHIVEGEYDSYEDENKAIARSALELLKLPESAIEQGLRAVPACRFEQVISPENGVMVVLDVGHNPDGIEHLFRRLLKTYPGRSYRAVVGVSKGKELASSFDIIFKNCRHLHLVEAQNERGMPVDELFNQLYALGFDISQCTAYSSIADGMAEALRQAAEANEVVVVCGSFFIMGAVRKELGFDDPQDFTDMNERMV